MKKHYHMIGINGIGLSGVAKILLELGHKVSGSDLKTSCLTDSLREMGATIYDYHHADNVKGADYIVVSSAIPDNNPEIMEAEKRNIPIFHRSQMLGFIMEGRTGIAISGTHGKTTTSSLTAHMLEGVGLSPTIAIGGELNIINSNARLGSSNYMVVEADESDASFLYLSPRWTVVTSIDVDVNLNVAPYSHLNFDYEKTLEKVRDAFYSFIDRLPGDGKAILCLDDDKIRAMLPDINKNYVTYGFALDANLRAEQVTLEKFGSTSRVYLDGEYLGILRLQVPGRHNVQNALAAVAIGLEIGLGFDEIALNLYNFNGVKRRFERKGEINDILVVDDYAHNPGKVRALLHGARTGGRERVIVVFQPHRYTRTKFLLDDFAASFSDADVLVLTEIYGAGECPIVGIKGEALAKAIESNEKRPREVHFLPESDQVIDFLELYTRPGDIVITCGAGDIYKVGEELVARLPQRFEEQLAAV